MCIEVEGYACGVGITDNHVAIVGHGGLVHGVYVPCLIGLSAIGPLIYIAAHSLAAIEREHFAGGLVHNLILSVDGLYGHILACVYLDETLGIGLPFLIGSLGVARHLLGVVVEWTMAIVIGQAVLGDEGEG